MPRKKVFFQDSLRHFHLTKTIRIQIQSNRRTNQYHIVKYPATEQRGMP